MKAKIAVATVSGKTYYILVNELKKRGIAFLSLRPWDSIPFDVKVVLTTEKERASIRHPNIVIFKNESDSAMVVGEAIRIIQGKKDYEKVVIGVDPGETFGVAILGDGNILETVYCSSLEETLKVVLENLERIRASVKVVKIGNGAPTYTRELLSLLDEYLPKGVAIEIVSEAGTSHFIKDTVHRRGPRDMMSAKMIAGRQGQIYTRRRTDETQN
jgi:adenosine/AMP kinase